MAHKVWYRNHGILDVDICADQRAAMRRAAAIFDAEGAKDLELAGIEDDGGEMLPMDGFQDFLRSYRMRDAEFTAVCPKWTVDVRSPISVRSYVNGREDGEWVTVTTSTNRSGAAERAAYFVQFFGAERVRVMPAVAVPVEEPAV